MKVNQGVILSKKTRYRDRFSYFCDLREYMLDSSNQNSGNNHHLNHLTLPDIPYDTKGQLGFQGILIVSKIQVFRQT
jgi:hypothetical protein